MSTAARAAVDFSPVEQAAAQGRWDEVRRLLQHLQSQQQSQPHSQPHTQPHSQVQAGPAGTVDDAVQRRLREWRLRAAPFWWAPLQGGGVMLRRTQADDAGFYASAFQSPGFAARYNRQVSWRGDLPRALAAAGLRSPLEQQALHWIVCDTQGRRRGLASLTSLNVANAKAEVSVGLPDNASPLQGVMAMLLIYQFAFFVARLNKLYSYVYTSNAEALHNSLRVGLRHEGTLKDHFYLPPGEFVDVHAMGLTRAQLQADDHLLRLARRRLGLDWRAGGEGLTPAA